MSRIFGYGRVSTTEQTLDQQLTVIRSNGYDVTDGRFITDEISGSVCAMNRPNFKNLVTNKIESGDSLVIHKLDRLGRDNIDIQKTISMLSRMKVNVFILDLPVSDLSTSEGKLMLQMFATFAEFERNRISERTKEALAQKRNDGVTLGRPKLDVYEKVQSMKANGKSQSAIAKELGVSISTVRRSWN